jgi:hypothetical protein
MDAEDKGKKRLDRLTDAGILLATLLIGFFLGRTSLSSAPPELSRPTARQVRPSLTDPIGKRLALPGVDWEKNQRTLVLALQSNCRFCADSAPFYQRLMEQRSRFGNTRLIAVLPQPVDESKAFLKSLGLSVDEIRQGTLQDVGVRGTPALLLVNSSGIVTEAWGGKLRPEAEEAVLARLQVR